MKNKIVKILFVIIIQLSGCVTYYPQTVDIPLISKMHDLRLDGNVTGMISANGTVSYGLTNHLALQIYGNGFHGHYYQGAAGYFANLGKISVMEIYGGYGYGYGDAPNDANPGNLYGHYHIYFTQFNLGQVDNYTKNRERGIGLKFGYLLSDFVDDNFYGRYPENVPLVAYKDRNLLIEPNGFIRFGGKKLKVNLKGGYCWIFKYTNKDKYFPYSHINIGLGLNYRF